jgi:ABC-2 type transport system permease protein
MGALAALTWIEGKLFAREPLNAVFSLAFPPIVLLVLAGVFGQEPDPDLGGVGGVDYYVPAYVAVVIAAVGLMGVPVHVAAYRERGVLRRFRASSVSAWVLLAAHALVGFAVVVVGSAFLVGVAAIGYDVHPVESVAGVAVAFVLGTLAFVALGVLIGTVVANARAAQAVGMLLFLPMWLLSGAGPPRDVMSPAMQDIADFLPLTYVVEALQDAWLGRGWNGTALLVCGALLAASAIGSALAFARR